MHGHYENITKADLQLTKPSRVNELRPGRE